MATVVLTVVFIALTLATLFFALVAACGGGPVGDRSVRWLSIAAAVFLGLAVWGAIDIARYTV